MQHYGANYREGTQRTNVDNLQDGWHVRYNIFDQNAARKQLFTSSSTGSTGRTTTICNFFVAIYKQPAARIFIIRIRRHVNQAIAAEQ